MNIKINKLNVNYCIKGEGNNILLLHGWGSSYNVFNKMMNHLSKTNKVYALDLPGFGSSEEPKTSWNIDKYVDFIIKFIDENKIKELTLIGHSFGGRIIIKLCNREVPFKINKIVLLDSAGVKPKRNNSDSLKVKTTKTLKKIVFNKVTNKMFPNLLNFMKSKMGSADYRAATPLMRETLVKTVNEDLTECLPNIKVPTLLIWGDFDTETPIEDAYKMDKLIPNSGLVTLKGKGHYSFLEEPETVNKVLDSFLGGK